MKRPRAIVTRSPEQLTKALGLSPLDAVEMEVRSTLNDQIIRIARRRHPTHAQLAKSAKTSLTRITAVLNRNTHEVSTDLLLRILAALGYRARVTVHRLRSAA